MTSSLKVFTCAALLVSVAAYLPPNNDCPDISSCEVCEYGNEKNATTGCSTCECSENPCHLIDCPPNLSDCVVQVHPCMIPPCPVVGVCVEAKPSHCFKDPNTENCGDAEARYYYNSTMKKCDLYYYGQCEDEGNNFKTLKSCKLECQCDRLPCLASSDCLYGRRFDSDGCPTCRCYDPCESKLCKHPAKCEVQENVVCKKEPCLPVAVCKVPSVNVTDCQLPSDYGSCDNDETRYFFDVESGKCDHFKYGGCDGNANNFKTMAECRSLCDPPCSDVTCQLACEHGFTHDENNCPKCECHEPCKNIECMTGQVCEAREVECSRAPCLSRGVCVPEVHACTAIGCVMPAPCQYGRVLDEHLCPTCECFDPCKNITCEKEGDVCKGFEVQCVTAPCYPVGSCISSDHCLVKGCRDYVEECSKETGKCVGTPRGVCHRKLLELEYPYPVGAFVPQCRTDGSFKPEQCHASSGHCWCVTRSEGFEMNETRTTPGEERVDCTEIVCQQPMFSGGCSNSILRFYYDVKRAMCLPLLYGGCGANHNNFYSGDECRRICDPPCKPVACDTVACTYGYQQDARGCPTCQCKQPCSDVKCQPGRVCTVKKENNDYKPYCLDICDLPKKVGPCDGEEPRYFYNTLTSACEQFNFGGCNANKNNFESLSQCQSACPSKFVCPPVCAVYCKYGNVMDINGCPTCTCNDPCKGVKCTIPNTKCEVDHRLCKDKACYDGAKCISTVNCPVFDSPVNPLPCLTKYEDKCFDDSDCKGITDSNGLPVHCCVYSLCGGKTCGPQSPNAHKGTCPAYFIPFPAPRCAEPKNECQDDSSCKPKEKCCKRSICAGKTCGPTSEAICRMNAEVGPCDSTVDRFYFDVEAKKCLPFVYGGCGGNENNFETKSVCSTTCLSHCKPLFPECNLSCLLGYETNDLGCQICKCKPKPCERKCRKYLEKCDQDTGKCVGTPQGVCHRKLLELDYPYPLGAFVPNCRNDGSFTPQQCHERSCWCVTRSEGKEMEGTLSGPGEDQTDCIAIACRQPKYPGPCKGNLMRHYYDVSAGRCLWFTYGGCSANHNNFVTGDECRSTCDPPCKPLECDQRYCKYGYAKDERGCLTCECREPCANVKCDEGRVCAVKKGYYDYEAYCMDICELPMKVGPCRAAINRYYYNHKTSKCELFSWGGCKPSENNFETLEDCQATCPSKFMCPPVCDVYCKYGNVMDINQCPTCSCYDPCKAVKCGAPRSYCAVDSRLCKNKACNEGAKCISMANCPVVDPPMNPEPCKEPVEDKCFDDNDCKGILDSSGRQVHCCRYSYCGGKTCGPPPPPKHPGTCPPFVTPYPTPDYPTPKSTCDLDSECKPKHKCCKRAYDQGLTCGPTSETICKMEKVVGPCEAEMPRFYFDDAQQKCVSFSYGGCEGNENNFETKHHCENTCLLKCEPISDFCKLKCDQGYKKDAMGCDTCECKVELCAGVECTGDKRCVNDVCMESRKRGVCPFVADEFVNMPHNCASRNCTDDADCPDLEKCCIDDSGCAGSCRSAISPLPRDGYCESFASPDPYPPCYRPPHYCRFDNDCEDASHKCCQTNFCGGRQCKPAMNESRCELALDSGSCDTNVTRYHYNETAKQCLPFVFGGCGGNGNNFNTLYSCNRECGNNKPCIPILCPLKCKYGNIRDHNNCPTCQCKPNPCIYAKCSRHFQCVASLPKVCTVYPCDYVANCVLVVKRGVCPAGTHSAPYPPTTTCSKQCSVDSECKGDDKCCVVNGQCDQTCISVDVCQLESRVGDCDAHMKKYFFNRYTKTCDVFYYGGCGGNGNRFDTMAACQEACKKPCPVFKCKSCEFGNRKDENGCLTCECLPDPCPTMECKPDSVCVTSPEFPRGYCKKVCKQVSCKKPCPNGYTNVDGCQTCVCRISSKCDTVRCRSNTKCVVKKSCKGRKCEEIVQCLPLHKKGSCPRLEPLGPKHGPPGGASSAAGVQGPKGAQGCPSSCDHDVDCPGLQKCCSAAPTCGRKCVSPAVVKPGRCPRPGPIGPDTQDKAKGERGASPPAGPGCRFECSADDGCHGEEKCCSTAPKCGRKCMKPEDSHVSVHPDCDYDKVVGRCRGKLPRYYYNKSTKQCQLFYYGGCGGNSNNFKTLSECKKRCFVRCPMRKCKPCTIGYVKAADGCRTCTCIENPCEGYNCEKSDERCVAVQGHCFSKPCRYVAVCRQKVKQGTCPISTNVATSSENTSSQDESSSAGSPSTGSDQGDSDAADRSKRSADGYTVLLPDGRLRAGKGGRAGDGCKSRCKDDADCESDRKCCSDSVCGTKCVAPKQPQQGAAGRDAEDEGTVAKSVQPGALRGECPRVFFKGWFCYFSVNTIRSKCTKDSDCYADYKCCETRCHGLYCQLAISRIFP